MKTIIYTSWLLIEFSSFHGPQVSNVTWAYPTTWTSSPAHSIPTTPPSHLPRHTKLPSLSGHVHTLFPGILSPNTSASMGGLRHSDVFSNIININRPVWPAYVKQPHLIFLLLCFFIVLSYLHNLDKAWNVHTSLFVSSSVYWLSSPLECNRFR